MNNVSFDFQTVEAELDRAEEEVEQRGGRDEAELKELIAEVRALHAGGEPLNRGRLAKYLGVIQRNGWIASPIAGTLLSVATGAS
jgi:phosphoglycerate dehydrogenase-like enzyme